MRRSLTIAAFLSALCVGTALAGPVSGVGGVTVDSTTFQPGAGIMDTVGGVYSDTLPPVRSTTTAAGRMTAYRALHINLRNNSGTEVGTSGNPLYTVTSSTISLGSVTITNSSFSVTGSTVNIAGTVPVSISGTPSVTISGQPVRVLLATTTVSGSTVTLTNTGFNVNNTPYVHFADPLQAGTANIGTVTGSTVSISNTGFNINNTPNVNVVSMPAVTVAQSNPAGLKASVYIAGSSNTVQAAQSGSWSATVVQPFPHLLKSSVLIDGSSNTVQSQQSGAWVSTATQTNPANLRASVYINGSSNTVQAAQSGTWNVNATPVGTSTVTFNGIAQPVSISAIPTVTVSLSTVSVLINGSSNTVQSQQLGTWNVNATPVGTSTVTFNGTAQPVTAAQSTASNLRASVSIDGSSNTVQAQQSGSWTATATQATPANLQASVSINGSSNTVAATQSGSWSATVVQPTATSLKASVLIDGSSNTVAATQSGSWTNTVTQTSGANLRSSVSIDGSSNTVVLGAGSAYVGNVQFNTPTTSALTQATINTSSTGDSVIVSTGSSQTVRVFRIFFVVSTATTITIKSGGATSLTGAMSFAANGSFILDLQGDPWFVTTASQAFIINQTGTAQISGRVYYTQS